MNLTFELGTLVLRATHPHVIIPTYFKIRHQIRELQQIEHNILHAINIFKDTIASGGVIKL